MAPGMNFGFGFGFGVSRRRLGGATPSLLDQMNQYAADGLFVSWLHLGDTTALKNDTDNPSANIAHNNTVKIAFGREQMAAFDTAMEFINNQPELVVNGTFDVDSNWTKGTGWTITDGVASRGVTSSSNLENSADTLLPAGGLFYSTFDAVVNSGSLLHILGTSGGGTMSVPSTGTYTHIDVGGTPNEIVYFQGDSSFAGSIDNVSAKYVPGHTWRMNTSANRPLYNRVSDGNGGFYTYLTYDGTGDELTALDIPNVAVDAFIIIRSSKPEGVLFSEGAGAAGGNWAGLWDEGSGSSAFSGAGASVVGVYANGVEVSTRGELHTALSGGASWVVVELRGVTGMGAWNQVSINNYNSSFRWGGDHGSLFLLKSSEATESIRENIRSFLLEQQGAL